jgi:L-ribulose-5-phosphate 4-epimerase
MLEYKELRREAYEANMKIKLHGLAIFTFGNVSAFDKGKGLFAIKPSGVPYEELNPEAMVVVDLEGKRVSGSLRPSSDTLTHGVLYRHFNRIGGITHTHSPYAVAWAQAMEPIPLFGTTHADHLTVPIPCTKIMEDKAIRGNYETETGMQIINLFKDKNPKEIEMVLVACHGPFSWGVDAAKSVYNAVVLEEIAKMALFTRMIHSETPSLKQTLIEKHYQRKHGEGAYYGQS